MAHKPPMDYALRLAKREARHLRDRGLALRSAESRAYAEEARRAARIKDLARRVAKEQLDIRGCVCVLCGAPAEHRHHPNHTRPLDVVLVCDLCHRALHAGNLWVSPPTWSEIWHS